VPALLLILSFCAPASFALDPNICDAPGEEPDVVVHSIYQKQRHGTLGGITAFSLGTVSCNIGTCWLKWFANTAEHPVIGQNMFRLKDGRFEHIGQSWLKHGFFATSDAFCSTSCIAVPDGAHLGVNCSDPYSAFLNGQQANLGPKFEVDAAAGTHLEPFYTEGQSGDLIYKRLQVKNVDLDPAQNPAARYFVEAQYVTADDAAAGNDENNAAYREATVSGAGSVFDMTLIDTTQLQKPAIRAWQDADPSVSVSQVLVDGLFLVAVKVTPQGPGSWHYEYAVQNLTSHRSARAFTVPLPGGATLTNIGFHDVDYHSGEPFAGTDWSNNGGSGLQLRWQTQTFAENPNANALRWGTLYNFRFDADVPPASSAVTLDLFRPAPVGSPVQVSVTVLGPQLCTLNGACDAGETCANCPADCADGLCDGGETPCNCAADCGAPSNVEGSCVDGADADCDGLADCTDLDCCVDPVCANPDSDGDGLLVCEDCNDADGSVWGTPAEVQGLLLEKVGLGTAKLSWQPVTDAGAAVPDYDPIRSNVKNDFVTDIRCLQNSGTNATDNQVPPAGGIYHYLVRGTNACPTGNDGPAGTGTGGLPQPAATCAN